MEIQAACPCVRACACNCPRVRVCVLVCVCVSVFQLANNTPLLSITGSVIAPSTRMNLCRAERSMLQDPGAWQ